MENRGCPIVSFGHDRFLVVIPEGVIGNPVYCLWMPDKEPVLEWFYRGHSGMTDVCSFLDLEDKYPDIFLDIFSLVIQNNTC